MAYDKFLAEKVRMRLTVFNDLEEIEMMGGLVFMVNQKMCMGVLNEDLMVRIDPEFHPLAVKIMNCKTMELGNRPMKGYVLIAPDGYATYESFEFWINKALEFNPKAKKSVKKQKSKKNELKK